ncbi:hypothetical protein LY90DRAFT_704301 [Neocallimastix californiae]|uniref:Uncharacterized protein n=1 Tax=Neocallimastix californiae TaxID=1754190 RepID=A0A1Y2BXI5_9FUNG|nr:hypothetical protein LY90DRAFT_704301 [Neocallimastix californiae]|eukprot:ORY39456.1 hypothetical protein LY90DRAFT_704301 [Neocallimastix californiae]
MVSSIITSVDGTDTAVVVVVGVSTTGGLGTNGGLGGMGTDDGALFADVLGLDCVVALIVFLVVGFGCGFGCGCGCG